MKKTAVKASQVGLVAALCLSLGGLGIFLIGDEKKMWEGSTEYSIRFSRTDGLNEGAPVTLNGVNVGLVSNIRFPESLAENSVLVSLSISNSATPRVRTDTVGRVQTWGVLGDKYIQLIGGSFEASVMEPGTRITATEQVDYEEILTKSGDIVTNAIEVTALLKELLTSINEGEGLVGRLLQDSEFADNAVMRTGSALDSIESASARLDEMMTRVQEGQGVLGRLVGHDDSLDQVLADLQSASADIAAFGNALTDDAGLLHRVTSDPEFAEKVTGNISVAAADLAEVAKDARQAGARLDEISGDVASITQKLSSGTGSAGKLIYDQELYDNANEMVDGSNLNLWNMLWGFLSPFAWIDDSPDSPDPAPSVAPAAEDPDTAAEAAIEGVPAVEQSDTAEQAIPPVPVPAPVAQQAPPQQEVPTVHRATPWWSRRTSRRAPSSEEEPLTTP